MTRVSPHYRLQPLLDLKRRAKEKAEQALARALSRLEEERRRLTTLQTEKEAIVRRRKSCRQELHRKVSTGAAKVKDGSFRINYLRMLEEDEKAKEEEIERQKKVIEESEIQVKRARRDYHEAVKELRVMEKHKELWRKKLLLELGRLEEREMDELGNVIHQLKKRASLCQMRELPT